MSAAIEARSVSVTLGRARVLSEVSATIERGEWVAVIGPNGAGKTTLLRAVAGLVVAAKRVDEVERLLLAAEVEGASGFVEQQDGCFLGECACEDGAL